MALKREVHEFCCQCGQRDARDDGVSPVPYVPASSTLRFDPADWKPNNDLHKEAADAIDALRSRLDEALRLYSAEQLQRRRNSDSLRLAHEEIARWQQRAESAEREIKELKQRR